ncbi:MAG: two-component system nitrogen regulation sensor histidine kinase NtrY [Paraglaciecola sp.]
MQLYTEGWKNMGFRKFSLLIVLRTMLLIANLVVLTILLTTPGYHVASLVTFALLIFQCTNLLSFITKTNQELVRFLDAARYADFSQRFDLSTLGTGFGELGHAFSDILERFHSVRSSKEEELGHLKAMVEHVPVPILSIDSDGLLTLWNNAARKLFGTNEVTKLDDLLPFGEEFAQYLSSVQIGKKRLISFDIDGMEHQLSISATQILRANKQETLVSMQDIQSELDIAQLQAWQDLVRVLTHEMMNSITPVASLAKTAVDLVADTQSNALTTVSDNPQLLEDLNDIAEAVNTVARRSDSLMQFVGNYRKLFRLPKPNKQPIKVSQLFDQVTRLSTQHWQEKNISLISNVHPAELEIGIDLGMVEQMLINLLQNAEHAVQGMDSAQVNISAFLNRRGHVVIEVSDNGSGIADDIGKKIFVPFFTTKKEGSGVGLALSHQVMLAHDGKIKFEQCDNGGALFRLTF